MEDLRTQTAREHEAWRALIADLGRQLSGGIAEHAVASLNTLTARFRRSLRDEEEHRLPEFEKLPAPNAARRAAAARSEHRVILDLLGAIERAVSRGELAVAEIDLRELAVTLELHIREELQMAELLQERQSAVSA